MKTLMIEIDCCEKTCGICMNLEEVDIGKDYCSIFHDDDCAQMKLKYDKEFHPLRCPQCLAAQQPPRGE